MVISLDTERLRAVSVEIGVGIFIQQEGVEIDNERPFKNFRDERISQTLDINILVGGHSACHTHPDRITLAACISFNDFRSCSRVFRPFHDAVTDPCGLADLLVFVFCLGEIDRRKISYVIFAESIAEGLPVSNVGNQANEHCALYRRQNC